MLEGESTADTLLVAERRLRRCCSHRFAIFTVLKAGFVWSGKAGSGVVIARLDDGTWSAPSCIATGGVGFGLQIGADLSEVSRAMSEGSLLGEY